MTNEELNTALYKKVFAFVFAANLRFLRLLEN